MPALRSSATVVAASAALLTWVSIRSIAPPAVRPQSAPPTVFSAERALRHLNVIARAPHPCGSPAHEAVREYVVSALEKEGLRIEVQEATAVSDRSGIRAAHVQNVIGRLPGTDPAARAILVAAHYDSAFNSPGASDDGAGVAAILEAVRALRAGRPLRNDVIVLLTDAEEPGLLGARVFAREHPLARRIGVALNFEARGAGGPVMMFETSSRNARLVDALADALPNAVANSLSVEIYRLLPNDTDFSELVAAGMKGYNFAYLDRYVWYHTVHDSIASLDPRSLQHHGEYLIALLQSLGHQDLGTLISRDDSVYFSSPIPLLVRYRGPWAFVWTALALALFIIVAARLRRTGGPGLGGVLGGTAAVLVAIAVTACAIYVLSRLLLWAIVGGSTWRLGELYGHAWLTLGSVLLALAVFSVCHAVARRWLTSESILMGGAALWTVGLLYTTAQMRGASYLLAWPLIFVLAGIAIVPQPVSSVTRWMSLVVLILSSAPAILLITQLVHLFAVAMSFRMITVTAAIAGFGASLIGRHFGVAADAWRWKAPGVLAIVSFLLVFVGYRTGRPSPAHPRPDSLIYMFDGDRDQAQWASFDEKTDAWTSRFVRGDRQELRDFFPNATRLYRTAPAPVVACALPDAIPETLGEQEAGRRTLRLRLLPGGRVNLLAVYIDRQAMPLVVAIDGKRIGEQAVQKVLARETVRMLPIEYYAPPESGVTLAIECARPGPIKLIVVTATAGLPPAPPRPPELIPAISGGSPITWSDVVLARRSFQF